MIDKELCDRQRAYDPQNSMIYPVWLLYRAESEVQVNRFEGQQGTGTFRPKVKGWSEGTKREPA